MSVSADGYDAYYQERLWESLPQMYQALDAVGADGSGPLHELLNRIGTQAAVVRRSIDGLWADQSIETCADWVVPYLADLVATQLVAGLDARAQRLDVANTINWRRRKGTVATVDAVARDITGWGVHLVEAFRTLARTRHNLDPTEPSGGFADLRDAPVARLSGGPFGNAYHHADLRRGAGLTGWYGIEKLIVYCWRLLSLEVGGATPVPVSGRAGEYTFDPTGRDMPLFLPALTDDAASTGTTSLWQVPAPLSTAADRIMAEAGIPAAFEVSGGALGGVQPEIGRFRLRTRNADPGTVSYWYGFGGPIGAGTADLTGGASLHAVAETTVSGGSGLDQALRAAQAGSAVTIADSRTYTAVADVSTALPGASVSSAGAPQALTVRAMPGERPVIRLAEQSPPWVFTGGEGASLVLDGLFITGGDIVLRGQFDHVTIVGCTFDPGTLAGSHAAGSADPALRALSRRRPAAALARSVDGRPLTPTRIWIEALPGRPAGPPGAIRCLEVQRSILGPIRTRSGGLAETVAISDSIIQGFRTSEEAGFTADAVFDPVLLYDLLSPGSATPRHPRAAANPLSAFIWQTVGSRIPAADRRQLLARQPDPPAAALADALNHLMSHDVYSPERFEGVVLSPGAEELLGHGDAARAFRNRLLLEDGYPLALAPAACAVADATVHLNRVTVLGTLIAHRLHATDSILSGFTVTDDLADGCVRYSAFVAGSRLPPRYNCLALSRRAALFTTTAFGEPRFAQLLDTADRAILDPEPGMTLLSGSSAGAQIGAFPDQVVPVKERALRVKYGEYLPLGLVPVIVHVT
jgi:hypothetical protein